MTLFKVNTDANRIYLQAVRSDFLYNYSSKMLEDLKPYLVKVEEKYQLVFQILLSLQFFQ